MLMTDQMRPGPGPQLGKSGDTDPFDMNWSSRAHRAAYQKGIQTDSGTIAWVLGPSYETPAEIRYFRSCGAHAVGMSTIPEVLEARRLNMYVLGLACISNHAAGLGTGRLSHEDVLLGSAQMEGSLVKFLRQIIGVAPKK